MVTYILYNLKILKQTVFHINVVKHLNTSILHYTVESMIMNNNPQNLNFKQKKLYPNLESVITNT